MKTLLLSFAVTLAGVVLQCLSGKNVDDNPFSTVPDTTQQVILPAMDPGSATN